METNCGKLIKAARQKAGLTQGALAHKAGITRSAVSMYEIGMSAPSVDTLISLLNASGYRLGLHPIPNTSDEASNR